MTKHARRGIALALSSLMIFMSVGRSSAMIAPVSAVSQNAAIQRANDMQTVQTFLEQKQVREQLGKFGMSDNEIQIRLAQLSDTELHQVATHIDKERPAADAAGFVVTILVIGVLVLLFVYLAKRV